MSGTLSLSAQITFPVSQDPIEAAVLWFPSHNQLDDAMNQWRTSRGTIRGREWRHKWDMATCLCECCDQGRFERSQLCIFRLPPRPQSCFNTHRHGNAPPCLERCTHCCHRAFYRTHLLIRNKAMYENGDENHRSGDLSDQYRSTAAFSVCKVTAKRAPSIFSVDSPQSCFRGSTGLSH